jgi:RNA polymerase sigma-70 factor (ECF subfamily)
MPRAGLPIEETTLQEFLIRDAGRLRRYVASKIPADLRSVTSPDDITQEVWIAAFRGVSEFRADEPDALVRWVTTLANRRLVDTFKTARRLKRRGPIADVKMGDRPATSFVGLFDRVGSSNRTPSGEASAKEVAQVVRIALAGLSDSYRSILWMRHIEGRSVAEIAQRTRRTLPAVHSLLFRARKELSDRLGRASRFFSDVPTPRSGT